MIRLLFEKDKQYFVVTIQNKIITYWDKFAGKVWGTSLQYLPPDPATAEKIRMSRNRIPKDFAVMLNASKQDLEDDEKCNTDEEIAQFVILDAKRGGCKLIKEKKSG